MGRQDACLFGLAGEPGGSLLSIPRQVPTAGQEHLLSEHLTPPELHKGSTLNPEIIRLEKPQSAPPPVAQCLAQCLAHAGAVTSPHF